MGTRFQCEGKSWIWDYAKRLGCAVQKVGPEDFKLYSDGASFEISCTMRTVQEAEAIREIIRILVQSQLPASRPMVHGDIYWTPPPPSETYAEKVARVFGSLVPA